MNIAHEKIDPAPAGASEAVHFDVLIVGAGISGIDAAHHLQQQHPGRTFAMIERQEAFGGTWRTHRYPGIRSDSDLHTFGFSWKPWTGPAIATAQEILDYLEEALEEQDLGRHIRYGHRVETARWSSKDKRWTLTVRRLADDAELKFTCGFLWMCQGYYRHEEPYTPEWDGMADFAGQIVHPQTWPEDIALGGKKVVVIGSGATAATLIPAIAGKCGHVTMLQRSPTWFFPRPSRDEFADILHGLDLPGEWTHEIMRRRVLKMQADTVRRSFEESEALGEELKAGVRAYLGPDFPLEPHFTPSYRPWRQRLAVVPDGDLFKAMRKGEASVVTDQIERFEAGGIRLKSGDLLEADVIVTATGFNLSPLGDVVFSVDGDPVDVGETWTYRGAMFSGIPNLAWTFGYLRTSWTMRADLLSDFICRLLGHMDEKGVEVVIPTLRPEDMQMEPRPFVDPENFNAGYIMRGTSLMPRQGDKDPWIMTQDYEIDKDALPAADLDDGTLTYA